MPYASQFQHLKLVSYTVFSHQIDRLGSCRPIGRLWHFLLMRHWHFTNIIGNQNPDNCRLSTSTLYIVLHSIMLDTLTVCIFSMNYPSFNVNTDICGTSLSPKIKTWQWLFICTLYILPLLLNFHSTPVAHQTDDQNTRSLQNARLWTQKYTWKIHDWKYNVTCTSNYSTQID